MDDNTRFTLCFFMVVCVFIFTTYALFENNKKYYSKVQQIDQYVLEVKFPDSTSKQLKFDLTTTED